METDKLFLLQTFALAWHWANSACGLIEDKGSYKLLGEKEYARLSDNAACIARYFYPQLDSKYALKQFMNSYICPLPVANQVFTENTVINAAYSGAKQLVLINQGYSTMAGRMRNFKTFSIKYSAGTDLSEILAAQRDFDQAAVTVAVLGCMPLFMEAKSFSALLKQLGNNLCAGSSVVFCYGVGSFYDENPGKFPVFIKELTGHPDGKGYTYTQIERLLSINGFLIYEHLSEKDMYKQYFENYNKMNTATLSVPEKVNYILAAKKETRK